MTDERRRGIRPPGSAAPVFCLVFALALSSCAGDRTDDESATLADGQDAAIVAGKNKSMPCLACHGAEGVSDYDVWPDLAGQKAGYLAKQLHDFRDGRRHDPWMSPMAVPLTDQDIDDLAAYFSSVIGLSGGPNSVPPQAAACVACHSTGTGQANDLWPSIAGQNQRYIKKQLNDFRDGRRSDPVMAPLAVVLSDDDIESLAAFYATP